MRPDLFDDHRLCDGKYCTEKETCARYMGNIDLSKPFNPCIVFMKAPAPYGLCPFWLEAPSKHYPQKKQ